MSGGDQGWQVGDLALRIRDSQWRDLDLHVMTSEGPAPGSVNRVINVVQTSDGTGLRFEDWPEFIFSASSFRKIDPHARDAEDDITIALLNGAPARAPEPQFEPQFEPTS